MTIWRGRSSRSMSEAANRASEKRVQNLTGEEARKADVRVLEAEIDKLSLICMAMWRLLEERTSLTEKDLLDKVSELDLQDGKADGKLAKPVSRCVACNRVMSRRHTRCLYCGAERLVETAFDVL